MTITQLNTEFATLVGQLQADNHNVGGHVLVAQDSHAVIQLKDKQGIQLVVVMPSTTQSGSPDAYAPHKTLMIFVLEKDIDDQNRGSELQQYQRTEDVLTAILDYIDEQQSEGCTPWTNYDPSSVAIDPEYREFGGWNGWSMTFSF